MGEAELETRLLFEVFDKYIKITASGSDPYGEIKQIYETCRNFVANHKISRILVDAVDMPDVRDVEKFHIGSLLAELIGDKYQIAILRKQQYINKFTENVAVNRGARLLVTGDEAEALKWLLG